ncbi:MAG: serine hydrolase, partial [Acetobacteraceae bacterium]
WIEESLTPCPMHPGYGLLWWLNNDGAQPGGPRESFFAVGAGGNRTWIDPPTGIVAVMRWLDPAEVNGFVTRVMDALRPG